MNETEKENIVTLTTLDVRLGQIEETLGEIKSALNGNGQPGIITRLAKLEERLDGTWKTMIILGWLFNFAVGALALYFTFK